MSAWPFGHRAAARVGEVVQEIGRRLDDYRLRKLNPRSLKVASVLVLHPSSTAFAHQVPRRLPIW
jgi:hypothetical protein